MSNAEEVSQIRKDVKFLKKEWIKDRQRKGQKVRQPARELLAEHLQNLKHSIDDDYDELDNPPRELDSTNKDDKKIMDYMIQLIDMISAQLDPSYADDDEEEEEEAEKEDGEEEEDDEEDGETDDEDEEEEPQNKKRKTQSGQGQYSYDSFNNDNRLGQWSRPL